MTVDVTPLTQPTEEKTRALRDADGVKPIRELCRERSISE